MSFCVSKTLYDSLGLQTDASSTQIRSSFMKLTKIYHPDINPSIDPNTFIDIKKAYDTLIDQERRKKYDMTLGISNRAYAEDLSFQNQSEYDKYIQIYKALNKTHPEAVAFSWRKFVLENEPKLSLSYFGQIISVLMILSLFGVGNYFVTRMFYNEPLSESS